MKIISIGDLHGKTDWKSVKTEDFDKIIFMGDYTDPDNYSVSNDDVYSNLEEITQFKIKNSDKVVLLIGNHDYQYITGNITCSNARVEVARDLISFFKLHLDLFAMAFQKDNYLWNHAGISNGWYKNRLIKFIKDTDIDLADTLNRLYQKRNEILNDCGYVRGGREQNGGPLWCDRSEIIKDCLPKYFQVVGHNRTPNIIKYTNESKDTSITFTDCLRLKIDFYQVII